jgi:hypothetical protein
MSYFADLTQYRGLARPGTRNVGWLDTAHEFVKAKAEDEVLERVWEHCAMSIAEKRGYHPCAFCEAPGPVIAERNGEARLLGTAEIRVFSAAGDIFAAPNLIYHYMAVHNYAPPPAFVEALRNGLGPQTQQYLDRLSELRLDWTPASAPEPGGRAFRFVKTKTGVKKIFE